MGISDSLIRDWGLVNWGIGIWDLEFGFENRKQKTENGIRKTENGKQKNFPQIFTRNEIVAFFFTRISQR